MSVLDKNEKKKLHEQINKSMREGKKEEALSLSLHFLELDPSNTDVLYNTGIIYQHLGNLEKAREMNARILDIDPKDVDALLILAKLHQISGDIPLAKKHYRGVMETNYSLIFEDKELWDRIMKFFQDDKKILQRIAGTCIHEGKVKRLMDLEKSTHLFGPEGFSGALKLSLVKQRFQKILINDEMLDNFSEMFFKLEDVWCYFLKSLNLKLDKSLFQNGEKLNYNNHDLEIIKKIDSLSWDEFTIHVRKSLEALQKEGKYKTADQVEEMGKTGNYKFERVE